MIVATHGAITRAAGELPIELDADGIPRDAGDELWDEAIADLMLRTGATFRSPVYAHPGAPRP